VYEITAMLRSAGLAFCAKKPSAIAGVRMCVIQVKMTREQIECTVWWIIVTFSTALLGTLLIIARFFDLVSGSADIYRKDLAQMELRVSALENYHKAESEELRKQTLSKDQDQQESGAGGSRGR
jgi:hypothetical protein